MPARPSSRRSHAPVVQAHPSPNSATAQPTVVEPTLRLDPDLFWEKYKLPLLLALGLLVAGLVGSVLYQSVRDKKIAAASTELARAKSPEDFQRIIDSHGGTPAAADALLLLARAQTDKGDRAAAEKSLRTFTERFPQHALAGGALLALAEDTAAAGKADEALTLFRQIPQRYSNSYAAPLAMVAEANLLREQGKVEDARRVYQNVIATYRQSISAQHAQQELRTLRNPSTPAAAPQQSAAPGSATPASPDNTTPAAAATSPASTSSTNPTTDSAGPASAATPAASPAASASPR